MFSRAGQTLLRYVERLLPELLALATRPVKPDDFALARFEDAGV